MRHPGDVASIKACIQVEGRRKSGWHLFRRMGDDGVCNESMGQEVWKGRRWEDTGRGVLGRIGHRAIDKTGTLKNKSRQVG